MPTDWNSRILATKIADFCRKRLTPFLHADTERLQSYLLDLIAHREYPPAKGRGVDWRAISESCEIAHSRLVEVKKEIRPALDAIIRALDSAARRELEPRVRIEVGNDNSTMPSWREKRPQPVRGVRFQPDLSGAQVPGVEAGPSRPKQKRGVKPKPVEEFPEPVHGHWDNPATFHEALMLHMQRHGETYWHLYRAIVDADESFDIKTIRSWVQGTRTPITVESMEILRRIERRYRLPEGYFQGKLPHRGRATRGHELDDISPSERRRLAWHLPDNFNSLPRSEQEKIVEWVRRVIISGATDYRRFQTAAAKHRYAIRFPGVAYGRSEPLRSFDENQS